MRIVVAVLLLATVLAGCVGGDQRPEATPNLVFEAPIELPGGAISAEPNVEATDDGRVWVVGVGAANTQANVVTGQGNLWRSDDFGQTWDALRLKEDDASGAGAFCSCDTDIEIGPDGRLYMTDFWVIGGALNGFNVESSTDDGETWPRTTPITIQRPVANDRQYITTGVDDGEVYLSYASFQVAPTPTEDSGIFVWRSTDGGVTFLPVGQAAANDAQSRAQLIGKMRAAPDGGLWMPYVWVTGTTWYSEAEAVIAHSADRGATWTEVANWPVPNGPGGLWPMAMDIGADGDMHAVWMEYNDDGGSALWYVQSADGLAWTEPRQVGWPTGTAVLPWVAATGDGRAVVAYYGTPEQVVPLDADPDEPWFTYAQLLDHTNREPVQVSPFPVKVGRFCPQGASCNEDRELLDYPGIDIAGGYVHVAFAVSTIDEGAGPEQPGPPTGGHSTAAKMWVARAPLN